MIFNINSHYNYNLYNTLLKLSRNIFFYKELKLSDNFETRIYLMFIHFSIIMIVTKNKNKKFDQKSYDSFFHTIENNLRENGLGDVAVNKKMKDFNKILYDILLKLIIEKSPNKKIFINFNLIQKYFKEFKDPNDEKYRHFENYLSKFYIFCFDIPVDNMVKETNNFKF